MPSYETIEKLASDFDALLETHGRSSIEAVRRAQAVTYAGRPCCNQLRPFFLDEPSYREVKACAEAVLRALLAVLRRAVDEPASRSELALHPRRAALLERALRTPNLAAARADGLLSRDGTFRVIELNPTAPFGFPGGTSSTDRLAEIFDEMPAMKDFRARHACRTVALRPRVLESLACLDRLRGGSGRPTVGAVLVPPAAAESGESESGPLGGLELLEEQQDLIAWLSEREIPVHVCLAGDLEYDAGGHPSQAGVRLDQLLVAGPLDYLESIAEDDPLWVAIREGKASMLDSYPLGSILFDKSLFEHLGDPRLLEVLDEETRRLVASTVPWTRKLADRRTRYQDQEVALLELVRRERSRFVIKPAVGLGGDGVLLGEHCIEDRWSQAIDRALKEPGRWLVQERVHARRLEFPFLDGEEVKRALFTFDMSPYLWSDGRAEGLFVRVSRSDVVNVQAGGGLVPAYIVD